MPNDLSEVTSAVEIPDPEEEGDLDTWPDSDTVFILTSRSLKEVKQWTKALGADSVSGMGQRWFSTTDAKPAGAPDLGPGIHVAALWWD